MLDASLLLKAAASAAGAQQYPKGALYVVATPIGNLADITLRAIHALSLADAVACEDTRVTAGLLRHLGLDAKPLLAVHEHNEAEAAQGVIDRLQRGERVAYASDAGTPAVSDPGARLVTAVSAAGHRVLPLPGASSVVTALSAAGDAHSAGFRFIGFLPPKGAERSAALQALAADATTTVLFEAPHRIAALAQSLAEACPQRRVTLCRELTKQFEDISSHGAIELPGWLAQDANRLRGEFVLVLHAQPAAEAVHDDHAQRLLAVLLKELPLKQAVALTAEATGAARNGLYEQALRLKQEAT